MLLGKFIAYKGYGDVRPYCKAKSWKPNGFPNINPKTNSNNKNPLKIWKVI